MSIASGRFFLVALALLLLSAGCRAGYRVEGEVRDALSGGPVYDARVSYGGRSTRLFTQTRFTLQYRDRPHGTLRVSAPGYEPVELQPQFRHRRASAQVSLAGREVPGWNGILAWAERRGEKLDVEIRLTDAQGTAIAHFPGLAWRAQVRIWENAGSETAPVRGRLLYEGSPQVVPNPESELQILRAVIPVELLAPAGTELGVLEFVLQAGQARFSWTRGDVLLAGEGQP